MADTPNAIDGGIKRKYEVVGVAVCGVQEWIEGGEWGQFIPPLERRDLEARGQRDEMGGNLRHHTYM